MATPDFVLALREKIGHEPLWLIGTTAVVVRNAAGVARADGAQARVTREAADAAPGAGGHASGGADLELLLVRRADNGAWTPVTGIIDPREEPADAAAREVLEEAGITAIARRLAWVHTIPRVTYGNGDQADYLDFTFRMEYVSGHPHPADGENTDARWFRLDDLPPLSPNMRERIDHALADAIATEFVAVGQASTAPGSAGIHPTLT